MSGDLQERNTVAKEVVDASAMKQADEEMSEMVWRWKGDLRASLPEWPLEQLVASGTSCWLTQLLSCLFRPG
jgi:hypothetical protein